MKYYHAKEINRAVNIRELMESYGLAEGSKMRCPDREHVDKHPSARVVGNICHCFACAKDYTAIDVVEEQEGLNFSEACEFLCKKYNLKGAIFYENEKDKDPNRFPLTHEQVELLGFKDGNTPVLDLCGMKETKGRDYLESYTQYFYKGEPVTKEALLSKGKMRPMDFDKITVYYKEKGRLIYEGIRSFWKEDREGCVYMLEQRIQERLGINKEMLNKVNDAIKAVPREEIAFKKAKEKLKDNIWFLTQMENKINGAKELTVQEEREDEFIR